VSLAASPLVVVASASGRASTAPSARTSAVRHLAFLAPVAGFVLDQLASNVFSYGFGWVLGQFGQGNGVDPQIAEIQSKLQEIDNRLSGLEAATNQLRGELAHGTFSGLVAQATPIIAQVNQGMSDLNFIASMRRDDPSKPALTERTLKFIDAHLLYGKQQELAARMTGEVGADGLIVAAYKTVKANAGDFWTRLNSTRVRAVVDYYQSAEARLLLLRVEYMHAHPHIYSAEYVSDQIKRVESMLAEQNGMLKPEPGPTVIADTRTNLDWLWNALFYATSRADEGKMALRAYSDGYVGYQYVGKHWLPPFGPEILAFVSGWSGDQGWVGWLNGKIGGQLSVPSRFTGVWTNEPEYVRPFETWAYRFTAAGSFGHIVVKGRFASAEPYGLFLVRPRTAPYWY
jgi:hypothetical protein